LSHPNTLFKEDGNKHRREKRRGRWRKQLLDDLMEIEEVLEIGRGTARSHLMQNIFLEEFMDLSKERLCEELILVIFNANCEMSSLFDTPLSSWVEMSMVL
jgi:hypothetical protein